MSGRHGVRYVAQCVACAALTPVVWQYITNLSTLTGSSADLGTDGGGDSEGDGVGDSEGDGGGDSDGDGGGGCLKVSSVVHLPLSLVRRARDRLSLASLIVSSFGLRV